MSESFARTREVCGAFFFCIVCTQVNVSSFSFYALLGNAECLDKQVDPPSLEHHVHGTIWMLTPEYDPRNAIGPDLKRRTPFAYNRQMGPEREAELQNKIKDLRKLIRRINYESNRNFRELEQENIRLRDQLQKVKLAYSVLDRNCERFQKAINYWKFMYEEEAGLSPGDPLGSK